MSLFFVVRDAKFEVARIYEEFKDGWRDVYVARHKALLQQERVLARTTETCPMCSKKYGGMVAGPSVPHMRPFVACAGAGANSPYSISDNHFFVGTTVICWEQIAPLVFETRSGFVFNFNVYFDASSRSPVFFRGCSYYGAIMPVRDYSYVDLTSLCLIVPANYPTRHDQLGDAIPLSTWMADQDVDLGVELYGTGDDLPIERHPRVASTDEPVSTDHTHAKVVADEVGQHDVKVLNVRGFNVSFHDVSLHTISGYDKFLHDYATSARQREDLGRRLEEASSYQYSQLARKKLKRGREDDDYDDNVREHSVFLKSLPFHKIPSVSIRVSGSYRKFSDYIGRLCDSFFKTRAPNIQFSLMTIDLLKVLEGWFANDVWLKRCKILGDDVINLVIAEAVIKGGGTPVEYTQHSSDFNKRVTLEWSRLLDDYFRDPGSTSERFSKPFVTALYSTRLLSAIIGVIFTVQGYEYAKTVLSVIAFNIIQPLWSRSQSVDTLHSRIPSLDDIMSSDRSNPELKLLGQRVFVTALKLYALPREDYDDFLKATQQRSFVRCNIKEDVGFTRMTQVYEILAYYFVFPKRGQDVTSVIGDMLDDPSCGVLVETFPLDELGSVIRV